MEAKEDFIKRYSENSPQVRFGETHIVLPCACPDGPDGLHWAAVPMQPDIVETHVELLMDQLTAPELELDWPQRGQESEHHWGKK